MAAQPLSARHHAAGASPRSVFDNILGLLQQRRAEEAIARCRGHWAAPRRREHPRPARRRAGRPGQFDEAEEILLRVIDLTPTFAKPYEDLGTLLLQRGLAEKAIPCWKKAARLDLKQEAAHFQLGRALAQVGRGADADAAFERSFALSPRSGHDGTGGGDTMPPGLLEEAERLCRQVLQQEPRNVDALRMLGLIAAAAGDLDEAENLLRQALAEAPDHIAALFELGRVLKNSNAR